MKRRQMERGFWIATAIAIGMVGREITLAHRSDADANRVDARSQPGVAIRKLAEFDGDSLDSAASSTVAHDPFRMERKPATVAFSVTPAGVAMPPVPAIPIAHIVLHGTIGGPPWRAIISGVPGRDGTIVVSSGDTLGVVSIRRVNKDGVTVSVKDSTWTINMAKTGV